MDIHELLAKMDEKLDDAIITLTEVKSDLRYHIKRTDLLEDEMKPVKKHVVAVNTLFKASMIAIGAVGTIAGIVKLFI